MFKRLAMTALAATTMATMTFAEAHVGPYDAAIKARQAHMQLYAFNLGILGAMAKGSTEYDAEAASAAASNLAALTRLDQSAYWPQGSDSDSVESSRALPKIWSDFPGVMEAGGKLVEAAAAMETAAGQGLDSLQGAMGALGGACGGCHKAYRKPAE